VKFWQEQTRIMGVDQSITSGGNFETFGMEVFVIKDSSLMLADRYNQTYLKLSTT